MALTKGAYILKIYYRTLFQGYILKDGSISSYIVSGL